MITKSEEDLKYYKSKFEKSYLIKILFEYLIFQNKKIYA